MHTCFKIKVHLLAVHQTLAGVYRRGEACLDAGLDMASTCRFARLARRQSARVSTDTSRCRLARLEKIAIHTKHADRLLVFMRIPCPKPQIDFRMYRIDFCHAALLMRIPMRESKSTSRHPLGNYNIIKGLSRSSRSVLARTTLYRGPVA